MPARNRRVVTALAAIAGVAALVAVTLALLARQHSGHRSEPATRASARTAASSAGGESPAADGAGARTPSSGPALRELVQPRPWPVVIIGVDGMDWQVADPLIAAGRMPNVAALVARGARADLRSTEPMLSPLLWTTMATGRRPEDHGVCDFLAIDPKSGQRVPITSDFREVPALWNIASEAGLSSVFVAWWATWPAESVPRGVIVSDRVAYTLLSSGVDASMPARATFPPAVADEIAPLRVTPDQVDAALLGRFVRGAAPAASAERVTDLRRMLAAALTYQAMAIELVRSRRPNVAGVYHELIDQVCHRFMHLAPPRRSEVSAADFAVFSGAVDAAYVEQDRLVGELLGAVPADAVVILVSDHGFLSGTARPPGTGDVTGRPSAWHRSLGVFVAAGGPVAAGTGLDGVSVEDVAPTVLHLMGLPVGKDMPGRPVLGLDVPVRTVDSYDAMLAPPTHEPFAGADATAAAALEALTALGYVGKVAPREHVGAPRDFGLATTATYHLNKATSLYGAGRWAEAETEARAAIERDPLPEAWAVIARSREKRGDLAGAIEASAQGLGAPDSRPADRVRHVELLLRAGRRDEARRFAGEPMGAGGSADAEGTTLTMQALVARDTGDAVAAERSLQRAAAIAPAAASPHAILGAWALGDGRADDATRELREAVALAPDDALSRARLASALMLTGGIDAALGQARAVRAQDPHDPDAWVLIASVFGRAEQPDAALAAIQRARALGATDAAAYLTEAIARVQLGDEAGAVGALRDGLARHPESATLRELQAEFERQGVGSGR